MSETTSHDHDEPGSYCEICDCDRDDDDAGGGDGGDGGVRIGHDWICTACWAERPIELRHDLGGGQ